MGRPLRTHYDGAIYHVYARGNRREKIAVTDQDYRMLERYMIEAAVKTQVILRAWYPMPNHLHAMVETPYGNISAFMHRWQSRYARYFNRVHRLVGHVFQGRFGSELVEKNAYQKELIRYIALNPYRSDNPAEAKRYGDRYASHRFYMGENCPPYVWAWIEPMLKLFGSDLTTARVNYAKFLADGLANKSWQDFYKSVNGVIGRQEFIEDVIRQREERMSTVSIPANEIDETAKRLLFCVLHRFQISELELRSSSQNRHFSRARRILAQVGRQMNLSTVRISKILNRHPSTISCMTRSTTSDDRTVIDKVLTSVKNLGCPPDVVSTLNPRQRKAKLRRKAA